MAKLAEMSGREGPATHAANETLKTDLSAMMLDTPESNRCLCGARPVSKRLTIS